MRGERSRSSIRCGFRTALRLFGPHHCVQSNAFPTFHLTPVAVHTIVQRFEEFIAGRTYLFEVSAIDTDRFRASIVKAPGVPTALMPFYGPTADAAVGHLRDWLTRAHSRAQGATRA